MIENRGTVLDTELLRLFWRNSSVSPIKIKWLLSKGLDPNAARSNALWVNSTYIHGGYDLPLYRTIVKQKDDVVELLLQAGHDVNEYREYGTPLVAALERKDRSLMKRLLDLGASLKLKTLVYGVCYNLLHTARDQTYCSTMGLRSREGAIIAQWRSGETCTRRILIAFYTLCRKVRT